MKKKNSRPFLKSPEISELYLTLLDQILTESGRGALLIATSHIEEYLDKIILAVFPDDFSNNQRKKLIEFPGVLSSFSSKVELLYAFRYINKNLYDSLNELRKIRNDAAHSNKKQFQLVKLNERMEKVYKIGEGFLTVVKETAVTLLAQSKFDMTIRLLEKHGIPIEERKAEAIKLLTSPESKAVIDEQLPHWELVIGICCICDVLLFHRDLAIELHKKKKVRKKPLKVEPKK